ncbi:DUF1987 domain-containing protein [Caldimonas sp.]|uniref:DUF1987 domain-containing protein n=1 Tax=Caldimonas sp. TaxID=2838790 RepID=UPI00391CD41D
MSVVRVPATTVTPEIEFQPGAQYLRIRGECYPENPLVFFEPLLGTLQRYFAQERPLRFAVQVQMNYVNSASTKAFRQLFLMLDALGRRGAQVEVQWEHDAQDDVMAELGVDLASDLPYVALRLVTCA